MKDAEIRRKTEVAELIREVIIVEGRDDIDAVQKAVSADIIATHGYGISASTLDRIRRAYETRGIIILTVLTMQGAAFGSG